MTLLLALLRCVPRGTVVRVGLGPGASRVAA